MTNHPQKWRGCGHLTRFEKVLALSHNFGVGEARHFKYRMLIDTEESSSMLDKSHWKGMCSGHVTS